MPVDESVTVKGSPVRSLQRFIEANLSPAQRESVFSTLPAAWRDRLRGPILPTETVPVYVLNRLTEEAAKAKGESLEEFGRRAGHAAASDAIKGIYRFFALALTPGALLSKATQMWTSLYNRGELRVTSQTEHSAKLELTNMVMEPAACARMLGWIERMAELTGGTQIRVRHTKCSATGSPCCEWQLDWS